MSRCRDLRIARAAAVAAIALGVGTATARAAVTERVPPGARVWLVDPAAAGGGSGAVGTPLNDVAEAIRRAGPGDWIVVRPGDLAGTVRLQPNQHLVGGGVDLELADGSLVAAAEAPRLDGGDGPAVALASGCSVQGLSLHGSPAVSGDGVRDVTLADVDVAGGDGDGVRIGGAGGTVELDAVRVHGAGGNGIAITGGGGELAISIQRSAVLDNRSAGLDVRFTDGGGSVTVGHSRIDGNALGVVLTHAAPDHVVRAEITGNHFNQRRGGSGTALQLFLAAASTAKSQLEAVVRGNRIGSTARPGAGSAQGNGLELFASGAGTLTALIADNSVRGIRNGSALAVSSSSHSGALNLTLRGNDLSVAPSDGSPLAGLELVAGTTPSDAGRVCADLAGNVAFVGGDDAAGATLTTVAGRPTIELVGYRGEADDLAAVAAFLDRVADTVSPPAGGQSSIAAGTVAGRTEPCPRP